MNLRIRRQHIKDIRKFVGEDAVLTAMQTLKANLPPMINDSNKKASVKYRSGRSLSGFGVLRLVLKKASAGSSSGSL